MGLFPIIMNILQFWLIDSIVKSKDSDHSKNILPTITPRHSDDNEPLFAADEFEDGLHEEGDSSIDADEVDVVVTATDLESGGKTPPYRRMSSRKSSMDERKSTPSTSVATSTPATPARAQDD